MYDATEKARRDRQWALNAKMTEGKIEGKIEGKLEGKLEGEIKLIRTLEVLLGREPTDESLLKAQKLEELQKVSNELQTQLRSRIG